MVSTFSLYPLHLDSYDPRPLKANNMFHFHKLGRNPYTTGLLYGSTVTVKAPSHPHAPGHQSTHGLTQLVDYVQCLDTTGSRPMVTGPRTECQEHGNRNDHLDGNLELHPSLVTHLTMCLTLMDLGVSHP